MTCSTQRVFYAIPPKLRTWVRERMPKSSLQAAHVADKYIVERPCNQQCNKTGNQITVQTAPTCASTTPAQPAARNKGRSWTEV